MEPGKIHRKIITVWIGLSIAIYGILVFRLFTIQVLEKGRYSTILRNKSRVKITLKGSRGLILDRNFNVLADNVYRYSFGVDLSAVKNRARLATVFARYTRRSPKFYLRKMRAKSGFVYLVRDVSKDDMQQWVLPNRKKEPGIQTIRENRRIYPYNQAAGPIIGFTNVDNHGVSGIEAEYNSILQGQDGWKYFRMDARRVLSPGLNLPEKPPTKGENLVLSLDMNYQMIAEEELSKGIQENEARSGTLVMLDPNTGEVLAMVSYPAFDPNHYGDYGVARFRNRAISDVYEPGSTFKLVTAAAALQNHVFSLQDPIFCENGTYKMHNVLIRDHKPFGKLTFQEVIEHSSNIGVAKIAQKVGAKRIYNQARAFGFGNPTGVDLPGEASGRLRNAIDWSGADATRIPIGYGVSITALQLAAAYAAVANGGILIRPHVVTQIMDSNGRVVREIRPEKIRRVISKKTAAKLNQVFKGVVARGTGRRAALKNVIVAGKTGTAQKYDPQTHSYSRRRYVASFVGYVPADNSKIICAVVINEPKKKYYGGEVAAPIFRKIMQRIVDGVEKPALRNPVASAAGGNSPSGLVAVPDVRYLSYTKARSVLEGAGLKIAAATHGNFVVQQNPAPDKLVKPGRLVSVKLTRKSTAVTEQDAALPNVRGLTLRQAVTLLASKGFQVKIEGSGFVVGQSLVNSRKKICKIVCKPRVNAG